MAQRWIGTSWKMTKTLAEARAYAHGLAAALAEPGAYPGVQPFIIPPSTAIAAVRDVLGARHRVLVGAQNAHWEDSGSWTGEVSVPQVADAGAELVEIGHSERREHFGETIATTRLKICAALRHGLAPLLCVGEPSAVRESGDSTSYILAQVRGGLAGLPEESLAEVILAYEPIWAIGEHGRPATTAELVDPFASLEAEFGTRVRAVLYGGSVNHDNAAELLTIPGVDGLFIGRSAWHLTDYLRLLDIASLGRSCESDEGSGLDRRLTPRPRGRSLRRRGTRSPGRRS